MSRNTTKFKRGIASCIITTILCTTLHMSMPRRAEAQVLVLDAANLVQSILQVLYQVYEVANQILELTPIDELILSEDFAESLQQLSAIVGEVQGLSYDVSSLKSQINTLFALSSAPSNATDLQIRLAEIQRLVYEAYSYALRVQTLLNTLQSTIGHIRKLAAIITTYLGNMQSNQNLAQLQAKLAQSAAELQVQTIAFNRARSTQEIATPVTVQAITNINTETMKDHPRR